MRAFLVSVFAVIGFALAGQPAADHPLTVEASAALREPVALGQRILAALSRYSSAPKRGDIPTGGSLLTDNPSIEVLHAGGYIGDSDMTLAARYKATLQAIPAGAPATQPMLTMTVHGGELIFDTQGNVAFRDTR
jgi:hypothetical protein